jgi:hypothetical protein
MMKTKTLLMVAGAGALVYWLWKKNSDSQKKIIGGSDLEKQVLLSQATTKEECELRGGMWYPEIQCFTHPCPKCHPLPTR